MTRKENEMAKKVTLKDMMAQVEAQAQEMAALQAKLDAMTAQVASAQAKAQAEAEKAKAAEAVLTEVAGNSSSVLSFDRDIHPAFNFGIYAIPGGEFAKEKKGEAFVKAQAVMDLDDVTTNIVKAFPIDYTNPYNDLFLDNEDRNGVFVFKDGKEYRRHFYRGKAYNLYKVELDDNGESHLVSNGWGEAPVQYKDVERPTMQGRLKMRILTDAEIAKEVWQRLRKATYRKTEYEFNLPYVKSNKLPEYKTPGGKTKATTATKAGGTRRAPKGALAAYITAFDSADWGEYSAIQYSANMPNWRKVQLDGRTVAALCIKGAGYTFECSSKALVNANIDPDTVKKSGSRYYYTVETPAQVKEFCDCQR